MPYLWVYLLIPAIAVLVDFLASYLILNRISIYGRLAPDDGSRRFREFVFAIQNDEARLYENVRRPIRLEFSSRSRHSLAERGTSVRASAGPDDEIIVVPKSDQPGVLTIDIPRMRPWKTWIVRLRTDPAIHSVRMEVHVPKRSILRGILTKINEHTFMFSDVGYHSEHIDVTKSPVWRRTKGGRKGMLHVVIPMILLASWFYFVYATSYLVPYRDRFAALHPTDIRTDLLNLSYLWLDGLLFTVGFVVVCLLARTPAVPLAPGYERLRNPRDAASLKRSDGGTVLL
jgi:hypothetical protein